jgi:hypothetical protein
MLTDSGVPLPDQLARSPFALHPTEKRKQDKNDNNNKRKHKKVNNNNHSNQEEDSTTRKEYKEEYKDRKRRKQNTADAKQDVAFPSGYDSWQKELSRRRWMQK